MRNIGKTILRWFYILFLYAIFTVAIYFIMKHFIDRIELSPAGFFLEEWQGYIYRMFIYTAGISLGLVVLWNFIFYRHILGKRGMTTGVNVFAGFFLLLHVALAALSLWLLVAPYLQWLGMLLNEAPKEAISLLIPQLFIIPFFLATRLFAPEVISYRFSILKKLRSKLGLTYY